MSKGNGPAYIVLGATGGIGDELVRRLTQSGARVLAGGRDQGKLDSLAEKHGASIAGLDATKTDEVDGLFERAKEEFGNIDGAACCVGSFMMKPAHLTSEEELSETMALNLNTAFATIKAAANHMPDGGSVVLLSSVAADVGLANHEAIAAAKGAVAALGRSAATSYLSRGLRVNVVAPGLVQTRMTESVTRSETARQASQELHPPGRLGEPEDGASAIAWLLDPEQSWITGQTISVDGGLSTLHPMPCRSQKSG